MIASRWMEGYHGDRGSAYGVMHVWCRVVEFLRIIACVDVLSVVSYVAYANIQRFLNECVGTTCL